MDMIFWCEVEIVHLEGCNIGLRKASLFTVFRS